MGIKSFLLGKKLEKRSANDGLDTVDTSGANNPFGSMGRRKIPIPITKDFIPTDDNGGIQIVSDDNAHARWMGLDTVDMQYQAYNCCSPLAAVIDRTAEADTNGIVKFRDEDGNVLKLSSIRKNPVLNRIKKLFSKPNPFQTYFEFNASQVAMNKLYGYCPVFVIRPLGMHKSYAKAMVNLNPYYWRPVQNPDFDIYSDDESKRNPILHWQGSIHGKYYNIPSSDIILMKDGVLDQRLNVLGLPISKVVGLDFAVSNICASMEADNVLLKKKGPLGVFSYDPKPDMAGWTPMGKEDKDDIQSDLQRYGLTIGQLQYIISKMPIKWNPMSFNAAELTTKETVRQGTDMICDRFSYPAELMSGKNATYENRSSAEKYYYWNNVQPSSLRKTALYNEFFELEEYKIFIDFDHLPVLQEDIVQAGTASKNEAEALLIEWNAGQITWNQWQVARDRDQVAGMDIYYPEWAKKNGINLNKDNGTDTPKDN